jgi:hypothetical protein
MRMFLLVSFVFFSLTGFSRRIYLKPSFQNAAEIRRSQAATYAAYDTIVLKGTYSAIDINGLWGANSLKPLVIIPEGAVLITTRLNFQSCGNITVDGLKYMLKIEGHPYLRMSGGHGIDIFGNCKNIEITGVYIHNKTTGIHVTSPVYCKSQDSLNYKGGGGQTNIYIHHNKIVGSFYEGMYISTTSPMNHNNDPRIPDGCSNYRPEPARAKDVRVLHNIVDSSGRPGILFGAVDGIAEIGFNTVTTSGYNGNDAQGPNITTGTFTHAWIHDNICDNAFTNNIVVFGSAVIENNKLSRDFSLRTPPYSAIEGADLGSYDPNEMVTIPNNAAALYGNQTSAIYISTRPSIYKDPVRNEVRGYMDSSSFQIRNNIIASPKRWGVWIEDGYKMMKKNGNRVFNTPKVGAESQIKFSKSSK